jgi:predicted Zn-dependent protease
MVLSHEISHVYHDHTGSRMQEVGFLAACQLAIISILDPTGLATLGLELVLGSMVSTRWSLLM